MHKKWAQQDSNLRPSDYESLYVAASRLQESVVGGFSARTAQPSRFAIASFNAVTTFSAKSLSSVSRTTSSLIGFFISTLYFAFLEIRKNKIPAMPEYEPTCKHCEYSPRSEIATRADKTAKTIAKNTGKNRFGSCACREAEVMFESS